MPTSVTTTLPSGIRRGPRRARRRTRSAPTAGFTLLEILIVAFLVGILSVLFMPRIGKRFGFDIDNAGQILNAELRYASERAISTGETHRLVIDLNEQELRLERVVLSDPPSGSDLPGSPALLDLKPPRSGRESKPVSERQGDWHSLKVDGVEMEAVVIGDQEFTEDQAAITFTGDGGADDAAIRLVDSDGNRLTLRVLPFTAEVKVEIEPNG